MESTSKNSKHRSEEKIAINLLKNGFPKRHVEKINTMEGAGWEKAQELEARILKGDCMLILCGDRGRGKTQIPTYWASLLTSVQYYRAPDLMDAIRAKFSDIKENVIESKSVLKRARSVDYLVIDEFSELAASSYDKRTLTNLIDHRYGSKKTTIIITNTPYSEAPNEVGRSVWSRFEETGGIVDCKWASYRRQSAA